MARLSHAELKESWPNTASTDFAGKTARQLVVNLTAATGQRSGRSVALAVDIDEGTLRNGLAGASWPDLCTVARFKMAQGCRLYPAGCWQSCCVNSHATVAVVVAAAKGTVYDDGWPHITFTASVTPRSPSRSDRLDRAEGGTQVRRCE